MRTARIFFPIGICLLLLPISLSASQVSRLPPPLYNEVVLKKQFDAFMATLDYLSVSRDYPKAVRKLLSGNTGKQLEAVRTLVATGEIEVIPWLLPFLEYGNNPLQIWTGASLDQLVSAHVLKRRDMGRPDVVLIRPPQAQDRDLRPLAWVILKMFRRPDDGNTHAYAASMTRYLGLYEFRRELERGLQSRHPAVSNKAKWALESLARQKEYEKALPDQAAGYSGQ